MKIIVTATPAVQPETHLVARLQAEGYRTGVPEPVRSGTLAIDQHLARRCRCAHCKRRGLKCQPLHRGQSYRVVQVCPACLHEQEA